MEKINNSGFLRNQFVSEAKPNLLFVNDPKIDSFKNNFDQFAEKLLALPQKDRVWAKERFMDKVSQEPLATINEYLGALTDRLDELSEQKSPESKNKYQQLYDLYGILKMIQMEKMDTGFTPLTSLTEQGSAKACINLFD